MTDGSPTAPRGRRGPYAKSAERRAAIVEAAFEVFAAHGYQGGSLQQVADVVGMSQTSLLHYFPSKSALLLAVLERRDELALGGVAEPEGDGREPAGGDIAEELVRQARWNESRPGLIALYTVLSGEAVTDGNPGREFVTDRLATLREEYSVRFRELSAAGRLREGVDPDRAAAAVVALWDGIQLQWLLAPGEIDVAQHLRDYLDLVITPLPPPA